MPRRVLQFISHLFAWSFVMSFFLFLITLVYIGCVGTRNPDAVHTVAFRSHGWTFYISPWQHHLYLGAGIGAPTCALLPVGSGALLKRLWKR